MSDQIVETAHGRVRSRYTNAAWYALSPRAITDAIYREIEQIDAERLAGLLSDSSMLVSSGRAECVEEPDAATAMAAE